MSDVRYSVDSLMLAMRDALVAVAPVLDRIGLRHRPSEAAYDEWEDLEAQVFRSVIGEPVELSGALPLARYGFHLDGLAGMSFVQVDAAGGETAALIGFHSRGESFDTIRGAKLNMDSLAVVGTVDIPFAGARMQLCVNRQGVLQKFEYLSY